LCSGESVRRMGIAEYDVKGGGNAVETFSI
jgi:hypothetical protein